MNITQKLFAVQRALKAPKTQKNNFGGYNYRTCEDILSAVKPLLNDCTITISDEIVEVAGRIYVKATAIFEDGEHSVATTAYAREAEFKKGMDESQLTGATSSYARKYALNGLLLIDDTADTDTIQGKSQPEEVADSLAEHLYNLQTAKTSGELKGVYTRAVRQIQSVGDKSALKVIERAKDEMKEKNGWSS